MASDVPDRRLVRSLLKRILATDADLDAFVLDCFPLIHQKFGSGMQRTQKESLLLESEPDGSRIVELLHDYSQSAQLDLKLQTRRRPAVPGFVAGLIAVLLMVIGMLLLQRRPDANQGTAAAPPDAAPIPRNQPVSSPPVIIHNGSGSQQNVMVNSPGSTIKSGINK